jgi:uncharacterized phage protein (TIGR01671 family)
MRDLKFRAKILQDGKPKLVYFDLFDITSTHRDDNVIYIKRAFDNVPIDADTIQQFMGRSDDKENEIYSGDIVKVGSDEYYSNESVTFDDVWEIIGKVEFYNSLWTLECDNDWWIPFCDMGDMNIEVIGNIIENPELLEVK